MTRIEEIKNAANEYSKNIDYNDYADMDVYDAFIAGAEYADSHSQSLWISVEEQLPAKYELVLVRTHIGSFYLAEKESFAQPRDEFAIPQLNSYVNGVTHWMLIPELQTTK